MWGYRLVKNSIKFAAGWASATVAALDGENAAGSACILEYHRVAETRELDCRVDNWNVSPANFERQASWLAANAHCMRADELFRPIPSGDTSKPSVVMSFDDGFANFHSNVLPVLKRYQIPATITVVTRFVGSSSPFPFDAWGQRVQGRVPEMVWRPITWAQLEDCVASGLVSVGSHSHNHLMGCHCSEDELVSEAETSREIIQRRLGTSQATTYCYPYGCSLLNEVSPNYVAAVRGAGYSRALTTDLGLVRPNSSPFLLPRIEVHAWDSPAILRAKVNGHLSAFRFLQHMRSERRGASGRPVAVGQRERCNSRIRVEDAA